MEVLTWQARRKNGLTLQQLEALTGIGKTTLNNIENGRVSPTLKQLETIARALDMHINKYIMNSNGSAVLVIDFPISGNRSRIYSQPY